MQKRILEILHDCDGENDNPTCWSMFICKTDRNHFIWVCKYDEKEYIVEDSKGNNLNGNKVFKTLRNAERSANEIARKQELNGLFTD